VKRNACWGAPLLVLLAIPLFWTGGWAATGGSLLSVLALLACPLAMYFMMRAMTNMQRPSNEPAAPKEEDHA
jgi:multisubunit Na+/H+ antiporter MnhG subunit